MTVSTIPGFLRISEAAQMSGLSEFTIRREIREGRLTARRIGRCVRITDEALGDWMRGRGDDAA